MCGYFGNLHQSPMVIDLMNQLELPLPYPEGKSYMLRKIDGLVSAKSAKEDGYEISRAIWWYDLEQKDGEMVPKMEKSTFNARRLHYPMWRDAINERRSVVFASEIGETEGKNHYLMKAAEGLAIGAIYRDYETERGTVRSMALITREAHPRFAPYHKKAMPLFLPLNAAVIKTWLDPRKASNNPEIKAILEHPRITADLEVIPVKTFKRAEPLGQAECIHADPTGPLDNE